MEYIGYINTIILIVILILLLKKQGAATGSQDTADNLEENYLNDIIQDMKIELVNSQNREEKIIKILPEVEEMMMDLNQVINQHKKQKRELEKQVKKEQRQVPKQPKNDDEDDNDFNPTMV